MDKKWSTLLLSTSITYLLLGYELSIIILNNINKYIKIFGGILWL